MSWKRSNHYIFATVIGNEMFLGKHKSQVLPLTSRQEKLLYFHRVIFIHFSREYKMAGQADATMSKNTRLRSQSLCCVRKFMMILNNLPQARIKLKLNLSRVYKRRQFLQRIFFLSEQCSINPP